MKIFAAALLISLVSVFSMQASATPTIVVKDFVCTVPSPTTGEILVADKQLMLATPGGKALLQCQFGPSKGKPQPPQP